MSFEVKMKERAKRLIESGAVRCVIGYRAGRKGKAAPHFARTADAAAELVLNAACLGGLADFARREAQNGPIAVVANRRDIRALKVLTQERQIGPDGIFIIGFEFDASGKATGLVGERLSDFAKLAINGEDERALDHEIERIRAMKPAERWAYFRAEFDRCARCYACRAACPMCYCDECIAERNVPQWIETIAGPRGNLSWNIIRAWHQAGRCVGCGACERACPEGIKLMLLNRMLAREVKEAFDYIAGEGAAEEAGVFARFKEDDSEEFILEP